MKRFFVACAAALIAACDDGKSHDFQSVCENQLAEGKDLATGGTYTAAQVETLCSCLKSRFKEGGEKSTLEDDFIKLATNDSRVSEINPMSPQIIKSLVGMCVIEESASRTRR